MNQIELLNLKIINIHKQQIQEETCKAANEKRT